MSGSGSVTFSSVGVLRCGHRIRRLEQSGNILCPTKLLGSFQYRRRVFQNKMGVLQRVLKAPQSLGEPGYL